MTGQGTEARVLQGTAQLLALPTVRKAAWFGG